MLKTYNSHMLALFLFPHRAEVQHSIMFQYADISCHYWRLSILFKKLRHFKCYLEFEGVMFAKSGHPGI